MQRSLTAGADIDRSGSDDPSARGLMQVLLFPSVYLYLIFLVLGAFLAIAYTFDWYLLNATGMYQSVPRISLFYALGVGIALGSERMTAAKPVSSRVRMIGLLMIAIAASSLGTHFLMTFQTWLMANQHPWADAALSSIDIYIGFDWEAYFRFVAESNPIRETLNAAYRGLSFSLVATVAVLLVVYKNVERARFLIVTNIVTVIVFSMIGQFFPVRGAALFYTPDPALFEYYGGIPGAAHVPILEALRSAPVPLVDSTAYVGLIALPSYHTAVGILVPWALRGTALFLPASVFGVLLILATPINGGHYLIDLVAGAVGAVIIGVFIRRYIPGTRG